MRLLIKYFFFDEWNQVFCVDQKNKHYYKQLSNKDTTLIFPKKILILFEYHF